MEAISIFGAGIIVGLIIGVILAIPLPDEIILRKGTSHEPNNLPSTVEPLSKRELP